MKEVVAVSNDDETVDGAMVLMPLPLLDPDKELEGLHPANAGAVLAHLHRIPKMPDVLVTEALLAQLRETRFDLEWAHVVILSGTSLLENNALANLVQRAAGPSVLPLTAMVSLVAIENPKAATLAKQTDLLVVSLENPSSGRRLCEALARW